MTMFIRAHSLLWQYEEGLLNGLLVWKSLVKMLESSSCEQACLILPILLIMVKGHSVPHQALCTIQKYSMARIKKAGY